MDFDKEMEESKKDFEESYKQFSDLTNEELNKVANFTSKDIDELFNFIFENLRDLSDLDTSIGDIKNRIDILYDAKQKLNYQKDMTREDIFVENYTKIFLTYLAFIYLIWTPDVIEFLKRFIIIGLIGITSYDINARYFTSDYRKQKVKLTLSEIDKYVDISKNDINNINRFREMYIDTLKIELNKLKETSSNDMNNLNLKNKKMLQLLHELELDYLLEDTQVKKRIR